MILQNIKERPKCENPKCDKYGLLFVGSHLYCGKCVNELYAKHNKYIEEMMNG